MRAAEQVPAPEAQARNVLCEFVSGDTGVTPHAMKALLLLVRVRNKDVAAFLGLANETVSRSLSAKSGALRHPLVVWLFREAAEVTLSSPMLAMDILMESDLEFARRRMLVAAEGARQGA